jgi:hypothetical protein
MSEPSIKPPAVVDESSPQGAPPPMSPAEARKHIQRGSPSPALQKAAEEMARQARENPQSVKEAIARGEETGSMVVDQEPDYEPLTQGSPERGIFTLVGGWLDPEGKLHNEIELRAMTGHEEDLLGNNSIPFTSRLEAIMANCCLRFGTITDRGTINQIVRDLPTGMRTHMLICLRIASYYKVEKDIYSMEVECPSRNCRKTSHHQISLASLDLYDPPNPGEMVHTFVLPDSGIEITWKGMTGRWDHAVDVLTRAAPHEALTYAILARMVRWNGEDVELPPSSVLTGDGKKPLLKGKVVNLIAKLKNLSVMDREAMRSSFLEHEPGIDTDLDFSCPVCGCEFSGQLDVGQPGFFFPQATSMRLRRTSST